MSKQREEFEAWLADWVARNPNPATALKESTVWAAAWKASRASALEEAAFYVLTHCYSGDHHSETIRALKEQS